jgi:ligand-binding SRPBCC domain-containing protein
MIRLVNSACIESSVENVWKALSDIENVALWAEPILEAHCRGDIKRGVGAKRVCKLRGNMTITEKWIAWKEGESFTYVGYGMPFVGSAKNTWSIGRENGKTLLTSEAEIEFRGGLFGSLLEFVFRPTLRRMGPQTLAAFKYWVENGRPFEGKHSALPVAPVKC